MQGDEPTDPEPLEPQPAPSPAEAPEPPERPPLRARIRRLLYGRPRDLNDRSLLHRLSLVAFLAWVGLGADGLSSSSYGPMEAFRTLGEHTYLALGLAALTAITVGVISAGYARIIEEFPHGGGGYIVATRLLGRHAGLVSGSALLVDYVLTITMSIAAAGDALFSFLPPALHGWKLPAEALTILALTALNIRGVRESVTVLTPIFLLFLATHALLLAVGVFSKVSEIPQLAVDVGNDFSRGVGSLGLF
ncbi:MAG: APC family permease, partial [Candidatus Latescibacterota bacterium]